MKVSEFLRQYHLTGKIPDVNDPDLSFWSGWLLGVAGHGTPRTLDEARELAIKAAEFIEKQCR